MLNAMSTSFALLLEFSEVHDLKRTDLELPYFCFFPLWPSIPRIRIAAMTNQKKEFKKIVWPFPSITEGPYNFSV